MSFYIVHGIIPPKKLREAAQSDLKKHLDDFVCDLDKRGRDDMYVYNVEKLVLRLVAECEWKRLADVTPDSFQTWRCSQDKAPKTLNEYLSSINALLNWLVRQRRLLANPLCCQSSGSKQEAGSAVRAAPQPRSNFAACCRSQVPVDRCTFSHFTLGCAVPKSKPWCGGAMSFWTCPNRTS
jgi:hypothetical protein